MASIKELLLEKCPDGVEYKSIGEIAVDIFRGAGIKQDEVVEEGIPCVRYGEIYTTYDIWFDTCVSHTQLESIQPPKFFEYGDILFAITGESVEDIAKSCAYVGQEKCLAGGDIVVLKHRQNPKYLAYVLETTFAKKQKSKGKVKSKVVHSSVPDIKSIVVPIPPIEVQNELADILDAYRQTHCALIDAIDAEIEYCCDLHEKMRALAFDVICKNEAEQKQIIDICVNTSSGGTPKTSHSEYYSGGTIPWLRTQEINWDDIFDTELKITEKGLQESSAKWIPANCVIVAMYGATAAKTAINRIPLTTNQACCNLEIDESQALIEYVFYWLKMKYKELKALGRGSQHNINAEIIKAFPVFVPDIEKQRKVVDMEKRIEDIFECQISALRKEKEYRTIQHRYYIERLLSLKNCSA